MTSVQGTYGFMSNKLLDTQRSRDQHLHSPVDDLESFYSTAQWAAAFNDGASGGTYNGIEMQQLRKMIAGHRRARVVELVRDELSLCSAKVEFEYGPFFAQSLVLLNAWWKRWAALARDWRHVMARADALEGKDKEKHLGLNFLIFGYRGVGEYLELVHEHRASLQGAV